MGERTFKQFDFLLPDIELLQLLGQDQRLVPLLSHENCDDRYIEHEQDKSERAFCPKRELRCSGRAWPWPPITTNERERCAKCRRKSEFHPAILCAARKADIDLHQD